MISEQKYSDIDKSITRGEKHYDNLKIYLVSR